MHKVRSILVLFSLSLMVAFVAHAQWVQSDGVSGGTILSLTAYGNNLFAGTYGAGIFISTNGGISWAPASTGIGRIAAFDFDDRQLVREIKRRAGISQFGNNNSS